MRSVRSSTIANVKNKIFLDPQQMSDSSEHKNTNEGGDKALLEVQMKYCSNILNRLKRNSNAGPFLQPVDPVALGIPDYFDKIKRPMDLSTIKKKLDGGVYKTPDDFNNDMLLMLNNCFTYNPPNSVVHDMATDLHKAYVAIYTEMPQDIVKKAKTVVTSPRITEKPRRNVKNGESMGFEDYTLCSDILTDLEKAKHKKYSWPFMQPVTDEDVPGYSGVIKNPMDLSTMRKKFDTKAYSNFQEFVSDLELIVDNCYKFNSPGTEVYNCCEEFERAIKGLVGKQKDPDSRINDLRKKIGQLMSELRELEKQKSLTKKIFSLSDREKIGQSIIGMNRTETERVAEIVQRHCAYEYIDNDEIELNMQTIPDEVVGEISEYIQKIRSEDTSLGESNANVSASGADMDE